MQIIYKHSTVSDAQKDSIVKANAYKIIACNNNWGANSTLYTDLLKVQFISSVQFCVSITTFCDLTH